MTFYVVFLLITTQKYEIIKSLAKITFPLVCCAAFRYSRSLRNIKVNFVFRSLIRTFVPYIQDLKQ